MNTMDTAKSVQKWIDEHPDFIDDWWVERDEFAGMTSPYSIWLYTKKGFIVSGMDAHLIHESNAKDFLAMAATIKPCDCEQCVS